MTFLVLSPKLMYIFFYKSYSLLLCRGFRDGCTEYVYPGLVSGNICSRACFCC